MTLRVALLLMLVGLVFSGCHPVSTRRAEDPAAAGAYQARLERLGPIERWDLNARLAISDGRDGGSGTLSWLNDGRQTRMSFHGVLGKGAWRLQADPSGARLELADGSVHDAPTIAQLVLEQLGWKLPVEALTWWVKGLAHPGDWEARVLDANGRLQSLRQSGWEVEFSRYDEVSGVWLPARITARRNEYSIKMAVRKWQLGNGVAELE